MPDDRPPCAAPTRLHESAPDGQLLCAAVRLRPWPSERQARVWSRIETQVWRSAPWLRWRWLLAASGAVLALWVGLRPVVGHVKSGAWKTIDLSDVGTLEIAGRSLYRIPQGAPASTERQFVLESGRLRAHVVHQPPRQRFVVVTPQLRVVVTGTRFRVEVDGARSAVAVDEGRVRVESTSGRSVDVVAGESIGSDDPRLIAPTPTAGGTHPLPAPSNDCAHLSALEARRACYERLGEGNGLAAENALFALGLIERDEEHRGARALAVWQTYRERFPRGTFAQEVSLAAFGELQAEAHYQDALAEADRFLSQFPDDPRSEGVALRRANLLRERIHETAKALDAYRALLSQRVEPQVRDDALYFEGVCQMALGRPNDTLATWRSYRSEFPAGAHAAQVAQALAH